MYILPFLPVLLSSSNNKSKSKIIKTSQPIPTQYVRIHSHSPLPPTDANTNTHRQTPTPIPTTTTTTTPAPPPSQTDQLVVESTRHSEALMAEIRRRRLWPGQELRRHAWNVWGIFNEDGDGDGEDRE